MLIMNKAYGQSYINEQPFFSSIYKAAPSDYQAWLDGYTSGQGRVTHSYNYPMETHNFYVAYEDIVIDSSPKFREGCYIIIPRNIKCTIKNLTGVQVYFMKFFTTTQPQFVPIYSNVRPKIK